MDKPKSKRGAKPGGYFVEIALISAVFACGFALVSLLGYHPSDPLPFSGDGGRIENPCGVLGAWIAAVLFGLVGHGSYAIAVPAVICGLVLAGRPVARASQWFGWASLYLASLGTLHMALRPGGAFAPGGAVGQLLGEGLERVVGTIGAWLVLFATEFLLITLIARIEWSAVARRVVDFAEAHWPAIRDALRAVASGAASLGMSFVAAVGSLAGRASMAVLRRIGSEVSGSAVRVVDGVRRMGDSLNRDRDGLALAGPRGIAGPLDVDDDSSVPPDPTPTRPAVRMALAELEWEPTAAAPPSIDNSPKSDPSQVLDMFPNLGPRPSRTDTGPGSAIEAKKKAEKTPSKPTAKKTPPAPVEVELVDDDDGPQELPSRPSVSVEVELDDEAEEEDEDLDDEDEDEDDEDDEDEDSDFDDDYEDDEDEDEDEDEEDESASEADPESDPLDAPEPASLPGRAHAVVKVEKNKLLDVQAHDDGGAVADAPRTASYELPTLSLLDEVPEQKAVFDEIEMRKLAMLVEEKLLSFKIGGQIIAVRPGPVVTIFEFVPEPGVKVSRIAALADDLAMALKAQKVRIVAPIPGKGAVGIEIPSPKRLTIYLRELLASDQLKAGEKQLPIIIGKDSEGRPVIADLTGTPHLLIGGTTGSGKSVGVNGMLMSLLFTRTPEQVRFLLIDPKKLEFELYHDIPHLLYPIITQPKEASAALSWACREMDERYEVLARWGVRNIVGFNNKVDKELADWTIEKARRYAPKGWTPDDGALPDPKKLPYIVIIIDELADLMMVAGKEVEDSICRIAQKARACGIHLLVATQRPSVDVVTGLIKANLPTRIAYTLRSRVDSRTILDEMGAESLLGRGDCLYLPPGIGNLVRAHAAFVSDDEVARVTDFVRSQGLPDYIAGMVASDEGGEAGDLDTTDELYDQAVKICIQLGKASTSLVQRHLKIGYNRAANIIDQMERRGVVGPADGARPREILVSALD